MAVMIPALAVGAGVADAQIDGDDFDSYIQIEVDMFISGEAYPRQYSPNTLQLGDDRWFDESGSSWFRIKIAVNERTGEITVLETVLLSSGLVGMHDVDPVPGCYDFDCWTLEDDAEIEYFGSESDNEIALFLQPEFESRSVGDDWEITIETGDISENSLTQRFRFTFPKEQMLPALTPRPVDLNARYLPHMELAVTFSGEPLVRKLGETTFSDSVTTLQFTTDWSDPDKYIDSEAAPDGNGYVPGSGGGGGGGLFNGGGHPADGGHHGSNNGGWAPGTLADGSWFLDDGTMTNHPSHGMDNDPSGTIPIECELSDGSVLVLQLPVGSIGSGRDLIHICEFA